MSLVPLAIAGWLLLSVAAALVIGMSIELADRMARGVEPPDLSAGPPGPAADVPVPPRPRPPSDPVDPASRKRSPLVRDRLAASGRRPTTPAARPR